MRLKHTRWAISWPEAPCEMYDDDLVMTKGKRAEQKTGRYKLMVRTGNNVSTYVHTALYKTDTAKNYCCTGKTCSKKLD